MHKQQCLCCYHNIGNFIVIIHVCQYWLCCSLGILVTCGYTTSQQIRRERWLKANLPWAKFAQGRSIHCFQLVSFKV